MGAAASVKGMDREAILAQVKESAEGGDDAPRRRRRARRAFAIARALLAPGSPCLSLFPRGTDR